MDDHSRKERGGGGEKNYKVGDIYISERLAPKRIARKVESGILLV